MQKFNYLLYFIIIYLYKNFNYLLSFSIFKNLKENIGIILASEFASVSGKSSGVLFRLILLKIKISFRLEALFY